MNRVITWCTVGVLAGVILIGATAGGIMSAITGGGTGGCHATSSVTPGLNAEQATNAGVIVAVGQRMTVPMRGWVIAVATALQESNLINVAGGDRDSLGLFQQRPSQGWGAPDQIMNPDYAATKFFEALVRVPGWLSMPLTEAAQTVQKSATPGAYANHEARAEVIVAAYTGGVVCAGARGAGMASALVGVTLPPGTPAPVVVAIGWALAQLGTPYEFGGDCTDPHGNDPARRCDCSSLTQQSYRVAGIDIPRVTDDQVRAGVPVVDVTDLRPGDLIFIPGANGTRTHPGHVGMAIGQGLLVHAPQTGDVVKIAEVAEWSGRLSEIRRIVPN